MVRAVAREDWNQWLPLWDGSGVLSDETSARIKGRTWWEWVFLTTRACLHVIKPSRAFDVIQGVFTAKYIECSRPAFWVSDLHTAQAKNPTEVWQVCLAHQLRDCQFAVDAGDWLFAPVMLRLFKRALEIHKRREFLVVSTWVSYRTECDQARFTNGVVDQPSSGGWTKVTETVFESPGFTAGVSRIS
jgi:hypothetical protein